MYFLLQNFRFRRALELVDFLLRQSDIHKAVTMSQQDDVTRTSLMSLMQQVRVSSAVHTVTHCLLTLTFLVAQMPSRSQQHAVPIVRSAPVRHVLHSIARVMASYFCNLEMFVFPSHCVKKLPPLHVNYRISTSSPLSLCTCNPRNLTRV